MWEPGHWNASGLQVFVSGIDTQCNYKFNHQALTRLTLGFIMAYLKCKEFK